MSRILDSLREIRSWPAGLMRGLTVTLCASPVLAQDSGHGGGSGWTDILYSWLPLILVVVLWFLLIKSRRDRAATGIPWNRCPNEWSAWKRT